MSYADEQAITELLQTKYTTFAVLFTSMYNIYKTTTLIKQVITWCADKMMNTWPDCYTKWWPNFVSAYFYQKNSNLSLDQKKEIKNVDS